MFTHKRYLKSKSYINFVSLSDDEITHLYEKGKNSSIPYIETSKTSSENMVGDLKSRLRGAGVDFEENKPYEQGSDSRYINWRTYARTQQLYINVYNEDKRPSTYFILDQRQEMYFGTRKQLKIKQALRIAIHSLFRAMHQQHNISGIQITHKPQWHAIHSGTNSILSLVDKLNTPVESSSDQTEEVTLNDVLSSLQLKEGAELVIISDFHDMNNQTMTQLYHHSQKHKINLLQILDPIELHLPNKGQFRLQGKNIEESINVDCSNSEFIDAYERNMEIKFNQYREQCETMGIEITSYLTTDDIFAS